MVEMNNEYKKEKFYEFKEPCPYCKDGILIVRQMECVMPYVGRVLLVSAKCNKCGYVYKRTYPLEEKEPCRIEYLVEDEEDLKARVVKSDTARVIIPEIDARIDPGPISQFIITNVEGIISRIREALETMIRWSENDDERRRGEEILRFLNNVLCGKGKLTLIIEDPKGLSKIIPPKGRENKLRVTKLKYK